MEGHGHRALGYPLVHWLPRTSPRLPICPHLPTLTMCCMRRADPSSQPKGRKPRLWARPGRSCPRFATRRFPVVASPTLVHRSCPASAKPTAALFQARVCFHLAPRSHCIAPSPAPPPFLSLSLGPLIVPHAMGGSASSSLSARCGGSSKESASSTQRKTPTAHTSRVLKLGCVPVNQWKRSWRWGYKSSG